MSLVEKFYSDNNLHSNEGRRGVENLSLLCRQLGYNDPSYYGQFVNDGHSGCLGDIFEFLEDNPGAIEAIQEWIDGVGLHEWEEAIGIEEEELSEEDE